ncbi:hypothetical protein BDQ12DRAFT_611537 [Crucibulum laeve]|uniref:Uncharacterized protein n=1 Tax=Crucibulum laeve TaxID=68775 RepID=A0A5C3LTD1_9AGAR|nr:hypothetical protein BDQ12DRAFT_611537 [Crucibulum laeve]
MKMSKDEHTTAQAYGQSRKGTHAVVKGVFIQGQHFSVEGLLTLDGMVANTVVEGSMTREMFVHFLEHQVVCSSLVSPLETADNLIIFRCPSVLLLNLGGV